MNALNQEPLLVIGNRNYSSWSLRAWLVLRKAGVAFDETRLLLDTPEFHAQVGQYSPSRRVPVLRHGDRTVWDSLAIAEYVNDEFAGGRLWPRDPAARAHARSVSAEMHSGFAALRARMPMNCRAVGRRVPVAAALSRDIGRVSAIWHECRERFGRGGPWLYGKFSIADAMYAPVASRFRTYGVVLDGAAGDYARAVLADDDMRWWVAAGTQETETVAADELGG